MDSSIKTMEDLIANSSHKRKNPDKKELRFFVKESLEQIKLINEGYKHLLVSPEEGRPSLIKRIDENIKIILEKYKDLNENLDEVSKKTKLTVLEEQITKINDYHKKLLEWEDSIKSDIEDSQKEITNFYNFLFDSIEWEEKTNEEKVKKAINEIAEFHSKFEPTEEDKVWYRKSIEKFYTEFFTTTEEHVDSKATMARNSISAINKFRERDLPSIESQIKTAKKNADALLNVATWSSLVQWYLESKHEYKNKYIAKEILKWKKENVISNVKNIIINGWLPIKSFLVVFVDYFMFVVPLIILVFILVSSFLSEIKIVEEIAWELVEKTQSLSFRNRLLISLPFWWISWFGQRSISQKRRIVEEYNHKIQVVKMYLNFTTNNDKYPIQKQTKEKLNEGLVSVILKRPWEIYGRDETMVDKIIEAIKSWRGIKDDVKENINDSVNPD